MYGIGKLTRQKLQLYFEHDRSGGGEIEHIRVLQEENCAVITFKNFGGAWAITITIRLD